MWDTETTGLTLHPDADLNKQPYIIEFGAVLLSGKTGKVVEEATLLINPGIDLDPVITKITGIAEADLVGQPSFRERWKDIKKMFGAARSCIAHNSPFDEAMINNELRRIGVEDFKWPTRFCTINLYRSGFGFDPKLIDLYRSVMGNELAQTHRALDDVKALVEIVQKDELWRLS